MSDYNRNNTPGGNSPNSPKSSAPSTRHGKGIRVISKNGVVRLFSDKNAHTMEAMAELMTNQYLRETAGLVDLEDKCIETINALGFAMVETDELSPGLEGGLKNFSLIGSTNIDETIKNSRIVDPDLDKLTPIKEVADDKFKDAADSFYDLDEERSQMIKNKTKSEKRRSKKVAVDIARKLTSSVRYSENKMLNKKSKRSLKR